MSKIIYIPINEDPESSITKADLYSLYEKLQSLFECDQVPEKIIQLNDGTDE